jgi:ABC-type nitrate/sulfonate/bicarbonate transport system permease component
VESVVAALAKSPRFAGLCRASLERVAGIAQRAEVAAGQVVCDDGSPVDHVYLVLSGTVLLRSRGGSETIVGRGHVFGADSEGAPSRHDLARMESAGALLRVHIRQLAELSTPVEDLRDRAPTTLESPTPDPRRVLRRWTRLVAWTANPRVFGALLGYAIFFGAWHLAVEVLALPRFAKLPGIVQVLHEWSSRDPVFGLSLYTPVYYDHIWSSVRRIGIAFTLATTLGVPVGLFLGWSTTFREYVFPLFEVLRPIPILAWVPLAIIVFPGSEAPVLFLTFLASFFATALNTQLGVKSIELEYVLATQCLGASRWQTFWHVVVPGSLPFVFTGLQVSVGVAWFSLAAAEMVSGQFGLGYLINTSYTMVQYPTIIIGMLTLGLVGTLTSAIVRRVGDRLMKWRVRELSLVRM